MQRIASRSQFPSLVIDSACQGNSTGGLTPPRSEDAGADITCQGSRPAAWWTLLAAVAFLLASRGLVSAADPDNILLDFTAVWCEPCQRMSSIVSKLERQQLPIRKVDVNQEPGLAKKYGVESIPCFVLVANGKELERVSGITTESQLRSMLGRLPKSAPIATTPAARTLPDRKNELMEPSLGTPIPVTTPANRSKTPGHSLPPAFAGMEKSKPPFADFEESELVRLQNFDGDPARSSVRIRVKDGNSLIYGSGTIIDSQPGIGGKPGHALILTCGHIFRNLSNQAVIEIDLFVSAKPGKPETVLGQVLLTDADADLGLVKIKHAQRLPTVRLGLSGAPLAKGEALFSIGCGGGDIPSRENLKLTAINKYEGTENLECTNRPQGGRSGGGLFRDDELVGICVAADPEFPRGIYTGLRPIGLLLEKAGLTHLAPRTPRMPVTPAIFATDEPKTTPSPAVHAQAPLQLTSVGDDLAGILGQSGDVGATAAAPQDLAGAEIICIVRSKTPGKPSRVVIINQATERFAADLLNESNGGMVPEQNAIRRASNAIYSDTTAPAQDLAGAEIICIVRSKTPGKPNCVVIVNQATERFVADLLNEFGGMGPEQNSISSTTAQRGPVETSLELRPFRRIRAQ